MGPALFPYTPWKDTWRIRIICNWDVIFFAQVVFFLPPHDIKLMNKRCPHCLRRSFPAQRRCGSYCSGCCQRERMPLPPSICSAGVILCRHDLCVTRSTHKNQVTSFWQSVSSKRRQINYMISGVFFSYVSLVDFTYETLQNIQAYRPQKLEDHIATSNSIIQLLHSHDCASN